MQQVLRITAVLFLIQAISCKSNPGDPPEQEKTLRNLTWTRDTLGNGSFQSSWDGIWGSSSRDVYVVGHSSELFTGKIWHYNGSSWSDLTQKYIEAFPSQQIFFFDVTGVFGFGTNDVWFSGMRDTTSVSSQTKSGFVIHVDASGWHGIQVPGAPGLLEIWGTSSNDMWVGGWSGASFHFNGQSWTSRALPDPVPVLRMRGTGNGLVYAGGWGGGYTKHYEWNGSTWNTVESMLESNPQIYIYPLFAFVGSNVYSIYGNRVTKRVSAGSWQTVFTVQNETLWNIAPGEQLLVSGGSNGEVLCHYDGTDWYRIPDLQDPNVALAKVWTDGKEIFVAGYELVNQGTTWNRSFVMHGK